MWPVHMIAATAKPAGQRGGIGLRDVGIVRVEQQIAGHALAEIAAAMIAGLEQSDGGAVLHIGIVTGVRNACSFQPDITWRYISSVSPALSASISSRQRKTQAARQEERSVGQGCVSKVRLRRAPDPKKKK